MKLWRVADNKEQELLSFARAYLTTAFPNPNRDGCPPEASLRALASHPRTSDPSIEEHISFCSPCVARYLELLSEQRNQAEAASRSLGLRRLAVATALSIVVAVSAYFAGRLIFSPKTSEQLGYKRLVVNLDAYSSSRASTEEQQAAPLVLSRRPTDLVLELPLGSDNGKYTVSLNANNKAMWSTSTAPQLNNHRLSLEMKADLRKLPAGNYLLLVESEAGPRIKAPVSLRDEPAPQSGNMRSRVVGAILEKGLLARNWFSTRHAAASTQQLRDPQKVLEEADRYAWLGNAALAVPLYMRAEQMFHDRHDERNEIHARVGRIRGTAETIPFAEVSMMLQKELENPVVQADPKLKLLCLTAKGYTDLDLDPASAKEVWEQARVLAKTLGDRAREGRATAELGIISFLQGDGASAKKLVGNAFFTAVVTGDVGAQVRYFSMFGNGLNALQRHDEALEYFDRALRLANKTPDIGFPFMAYEGKAEALVALNRTDEAASLLKNALLEAQKLDRHGHEAQLYIGLGKMAKARGDYDEAINYLKSASDLGRKSQFYRMDADSMFELASIYRGKGQLAAAEESLREGILASRKVGDKFYLPRDLGALAELKELEGDSQQAEAFYEQATDVLDGLLVNAASSEAKASIVATMSDIYLRHFRLLARSKNLPGAFAVLERARGRAAADLIRASNRGSQEVSMNSTPADRQITELQLELLRSTTTSDRKRILADLFDAEQRRALQISPHVSEIGSRPITISDLQRVLHPNELLLEYVVSDEASYCFAISQSRARLLQLKVRRKDLEETISTYLNAVRKKGEAEAQERKLYAALLGTVPGLDGTSRLIVVPDSSLNLLPFDALRNEHGHYVLLRNVVTYSPSATIFHLLRTRHRKMRNPLPFLGLGDVTHISDRVLLARNTDIRREVSDSRGIYDLGGASFSDLPGTKKELTTLGQMFGKNSVLLMDAQASEAAFKGEPLQQFKVIHFAVHGVAAPKYPERAALVLGSDPEHREDGLLQAREIVSLHLNADLVTLASCETASGKLEGEEGAESLERAFLIAGAKTVVASLWNADDTFTAALVKAFYLHLKRGEDKGSALRNAKLDMIHEFGEQALPYYWAGFTMEGDSASPIQIPIQ